MLALYRFLTFLLHPFMPFWLNGRAARGKEDVTRRNERLGKPKLVRPQGIVIWVHAASVGEANSIYPLVCTLTKQYPQVHVLFTTITVTSAALIGAKLPPRVIHQFLPVDTPQAVARFVAHWQPDMAIWVESEFWPNLIIHAHKKGCRFISVNTRMSEHSFNLWQRFPRIIGAMLDSFEAFFPQSPLDGERLAALGASDIQATGNLKYDTPPLSCDAAALLALKTAVAGRKLWLAASTHPAEETMIALVHNIVKNDVPELLTIIVPRHVNRAEAIRAELQEAGLAVAQRSVGESVTPTTDIYLADTMGELGIFYTAAPFAFIGGSLIPHGGQNMIEAAALGCVPIVGPYTQNFRTVCDELEASHALLCVEDVTALASAVKRLFAAPEEVALLATSARKHVAAHRGASDAVLQFIPELLYINTTNH